MLISQSVLVRPSTPMTLIDWISNNVESFIDVHGVVAFSDMNFSTEHLHSMDFERALKICEIFDGACKHIINTGDYDLYDPENFFCKKLISHLASSEQLNISNCTPLIHFLSKITLNTPKLIQSSYSSSSLVEEHDGPVKPCYDDAWKTLFLRELVPKGLLKELLDHLFLIMSHDFALINTFALSTSSTPSSKIAEFMIMASSVNASYQSTIIDSIRQNISSLRPNLPENFDFLEKLNFDKKACSIDEFSEKSDPISYYTQDEKSLLEAVFEHCKKHREINELSGNGTGVESRISDVIEKLTLSDASMLSKEKANELFEFIAENQDYELLPLVPWLIRTNVCSISCIEKNINKIYSKYNIEDMTFNASTRAIEATDNLLAMEYRWSDNFLISCNDEFDHWLRMSLPSMIDNADNPSYETLNYLFNEAFDKWTSFTSANIQELYADNINKSIAVSALKKMCTQYIYPSLLSSSDTYDDVIPQILIKGIKVEELSELDVSIISQTRKLRLYTSLGGDELSNIAQILPEVQEALTAALLTEMTMEKHLDDMSSRQMKERARFQM
ncbi:hypothetical protein ACEUAI_13015 [Aeromonas veronii]